MTTDGGKARVPNVIDPVIRDEISSTLSAIEREQGVHILYACESGSRAWGFPSADSDYDVRFIYVRPLNWYLSYDVERRRDVIEMPIEGEIDCNGWDLRKTMTLFAKTNGALLEWLNSPIVYCERGSLAADLRALSERALNPLALCHHYLSMARNNRREYKGSEVIKLKKYFYVLRPLLAVRHIEKHRVPPPMLFEQLVAEHAPAEVRPAMEDLLDRKRHSASETMRGPRIPAIDDFISHELARNQEALKSMDNSATIRGEAMSEALNEIFRAVLSSSS